MFVVVAVVFVVVVGGGGGGTCVCRADGAIPGLACAETRVLARSSPGLEFAFVCVFFRIGFCCVLSKTAPLGRLHCTKRS